MTTNQTLYTPWGITQETYAIAPGILQVCTASHGGIILDWEHENQFCQQFPFYKPFTGSTQYFEEDIDSSAVILAFPQHFTANAIYNAVRTQKSSLGQIECIPPICQKIHDEYFTTIKDLWETGGMHSGAHPNLWTVLFTHATTRERRSVLMEWPSKQFYTTEELDSLKVAS